jgi:hypothetical protein
MAAKRVGGNDLVAHPELMLQGAVLHSRVELTVPAHGHKATLALASAAGVMEMQQAQAVRYDLAPTVEHARVVVALRDGQEGRCAHDELIPTLVTEAADAARWTLVLVLLVVGVAGVGDGGQHVAVAQHKDVRVK